MTAITTALVLMAWPGLAARIDVQRKQGAAHVRTDAFQNEAGDWILAVRAGNVRNERRPGSELRITTDKKYSCDVDSWGVACLKVPGGVNDVTVSATSPTCTPMERSFKKDSYCDGDPCLFVGVMNGQGSKCKGSAQSRGDSEDKAFCANALQSADAYGCRLWTAADDIPDEPIVPTTGGGGLHGNTSGGGGSGGGSSGGTGSHSDHCVGGVEISGETNTQSGSMGIYQKLSMAPSAMNDGRSIYQCVQGPCKEHGQFLYYWHENFAWAIGHSYTSGSAAFMSPLLEEKWCPTEPTVWNIWDVAEGKFVPSTGFRMTPVTVTTSTPFVRPTTSTTTTSTPKESSTSTLRLALPAMVVAALGFAH